AEALAIAAILAGTELGAVGVCIRLRRICGWARKRVIAGIARGVAEHLARENGRQRRERIFPRARCLERIAARLNLAVDVAGFAGDRSGILELVVVGLELSVSDAPILDGHVLWDKALAVARLVIGADFEFHIGPAPGMTTPMDAGAADHLAGQERAEPTHRECFLGRTVAHRDGVARGVLHQVVAYDIAQLVADVGQRIIVLARARCATLERDHLQTEFRQFLGENAASPAQPDDDNIDFFEFGGHGPPPQLISAMPMGLLGNGLPRYFSTWSRCTAIMPGKPMMAQPALLRLPP